MQQLVPQRLAEIEADAGTGGSMRGGLAMWRILGFVQVPYTAGFYIGSAFIMPNRKRVALQVLCQYHWIAFFR
jgi:hypothetical protein